MYVRRMKAGGTRRGQRDLQVASSVSTDTKNVADTIVGSPMLSSIMRASQIYKSEGVWCQVLHGCAARVLSKVHSAMTYLCCHMVIVSYLILSCRPTGADRKHTPCIRTCARSGSSATYAYYMSSL